MRKVRPPALPYIPLDPSFPVLICALRYSKYFVMASKEEFTAAVAFALSCVKQEHLVLRRKTSEALRVYEGRYVLVWFPPGYSKLSASALYVWREV